MTRGRIYSQNFRHVPPPLPTPYSPPTHPLHEWRKQRDVDMFGQVMLGLLPHVIAQVTYFYHPQTKLQEGNVFTPVCVSVHKVGIYPIACWDTHPSRQTQPPPTGRHTSGRHRPGQIPPLLGRHFPLRTLQDMVNKRAVCILLEYMLVPKSKFSKYKYAFQ